MKSVVGTSAPYHIGRVLLTGSGKYVGDLDFPGHVHMTVVRSQFAHGVLRSVDVAPALNLPGVIDAFAASDVRPYLSVIPLHVPDPELAPLLALKPSLWISNRCQATAQ
jgi:CO/xanthine dehydrogenase Mo-binding subunit